MNFRALALSLFLICTPALAHDNEHPELDAWYMSLKQPDTLGNLGGAISCCGVGDAYWADEYHVDKDGNVIATITDDREDEPLRRMHVPIGTKYLVPAGKIIDATKQHGNPTGHTVIFLGVVYSGNVTGRPVLCWVGGGGY